MNPSERKTRIKKAFSKAALTYNDASSFQREVAVEVAAKLGSEPMRLLDIGCGTGHIAKAVLDKYPDTDIIVCDISMEMVAQAKAVCDNLGTLVADCEELPIKDSLFDAVLSGLTFQWASCLDNAISEAYRVLSPGGVFIFSTLGPETMTELRKATKATCRLKGKDTATKFITFQDAETIGNSLVNAGFEDIKIEKDIREVRYRDLWELLRTLKAIGAINPEAQQTQNLSSGSLLREINNMYAKLYRTSDNSAITCTYEVIIVKAIRPLDIF
jgi:malonyl-CoA O-methyltransferase